MNQYPSAALDRLDYDFDDHAVVGPGERLVLTHREVLGLVQSALEEAGEADAAIIAIKRRVFEAVSKGHLADALRIAIAGTKGQAVRS